MQRLESELLKHSYEFWLARVQRIRAACAAGRITDAELPHYQRYIMNFGQVNANFTLDELRHLNYPKSPMMLMDKHAYSRMTENIFTEVLRQLFFQQYPIYKNDYPIFIDSRLFYDEINKFTTVVNGASIHDQNAMQTILKEMTDKNGNGAWVCVKSNEEKNAIDLTLQSACLKIIIEKNVPFEMRALFTNQAQQLTTTQIEYLEGFLAGEIRNITENEQRSEKPLDTSVELLQRDSKWYERCFRFLKNIKSEILVTHKIKKPNDLETLAVNQPEEFARLYDAFKPLWTEDLLKRKNEGNDNRRQGRCLMAINSWKTKTVNSALKKICYYIKPEFRFLNTDAIIVLGKHEENSHDHKGPKYVINNLGYRMNVSRAMDAIITYFPKLFIDDDQTKGFFNCLANTPMVLKLPQDEQVRMQQAIEKSMKKASYINSSNQREFMFNQALETMRSLYCENAFGYYKSFVLNYIERFLNRYPSSSTMYEIMVPELTDILESFYDATRQANLRLAIRAVQVLGEVLQTDLAFSPLPAHELMTQTVKNDLFNIFNVQSVHMAPFGMRTYLRVLQACAAGQPLAKKNRVYQTNQNYFEWIMSLRSVRSANMEVNYVRQIQDVSEHADIIFMEIHTNNVTEKKQFSQHLDMFLLGLHDPKWKKPLTLVIDITLNALDDEELRSALVIAKPKVESGQLNIVLNISLTKLYQAGLDEKSGGLNVVINNGKSWQQFNANFERVTEIEKIDESTLQYFSYFNQCKHQTNTNYTTTVEYVKMVNYSVDWFYQAVLDRLARAGYERQRCFKLTTTSDSGSIYLSFHSSQLLAVIDPGFRLKTSQIEQFNKDIVNLLILPMSIASNMPLSARMSIGFPLCSVNVALDSIRFTVGIEQHNDLLIYADILAHISYCLNHRAGLIEACFATDPDHPEIYTKRQAVFSQIVEEYRRTYVGIPSNRVHPYQARLPKDNKNIYGPFRTKKGPAYFECIGNELKCRVSERQYTTNEIAIVTGLIVTPAVAYSAEQFEFFLKCSGYTCDEQAAEITKRTSGADFTGYTQYIPFSPDAIRIDFTQRGIGIERQIACAQAHGLTVYKHRFSDDTVGIELDYWQEKDPAVARFIRFAIAIYINRAYNIEFMAQGDKNNQCSMFTHLLFKMDYQKVEKLFYTAVNDVIACKAELTTLLYQHMARSPVEANMAKLYRFHGEHAPGAPFATTVYEGASQTAETSLLSGVIAVINQRRKKAAQRVALTSGFFSKAEADKADKKYDPKSNSK